MSLYRGYFGPSALDPFGRRTASVNEYKPHPKFKGTLVAFMPNGSGIFAILTHRVPVCYTWDGLNDNSFAEVPCPGTRNDPRFPGAKCNNLLLSGLPLLLDACKCCKMCGCTPEDCEFEARIVITALLFACSSNYGWGPRHGFYGPGEQHCAGWFCHDWSVFFRVAIENQMLSCFSVQEWIARDPRPVLNPDGTVRTDDDGEPWLLHHAYIKVTACASPGTPDCTVIFDDGFLDWSLVIPPSAGR